MKKFILSFGVIAIFIAYAIHEKNESSEVHVITPKQTSQQSGTITSTPTTGGSTGSTPVTGKYKDGSYTGSVADAYYGNIQVQATIQGGKITDVQFLQYPNDRDTSRQINEQAMPYLKQEAIQAQNAQVDIVSGATDSSQAFQQSLQSALNQAKS